MTRFSLVFSWIFNYIMLIIFFLIIGTIMSLGVAACLAAVFIVFVPESSTYLMWILTASLFSGVVATLVFLCLSHKKAKAHIQKNRKYP